jgi:hypothetical protein
MKKTLLLAALAASIAPASAQWLYDKQPDGSGNGYVSQDFADFPDFTTYSFDDVDMGWGWFVQRVIIYGVEMGLPQFNQGVYLGVGSAPGYDAIEKTYSGAYVEGNLEFTFDDVWEGVVWVSAWIRRPFGTGGQWFWLVNQQDIDWSESYGHNPGGGFGLGTDPFPWSYGQGVPADMAMSVGVVPEPATLLAVGLGLAGLALRRKRR